MDKIPRTAIVLLAAGAGRRMGKVKQLLPWSGKRLLTHVLMEVLKLKKPTYLVLGAHAPAIRAALSPGGYHIVHNEQWEAGLGHSVSAGIRAILATDSPEQILVCLGDQPFVTEAFLRELLVADAQSIRATAYGDRAGVPAVFPRRYFPDLQELTGDAGARDLLREKPDILRFHSPSAIIDVDTPEDYQQYEGDS